MTKTFTFGKIAYNNHRKENLVTVDVELKKHGGEETFIYENGEKKVTGRTPIYIEFSASGNIWNRLATDILCAGQCLDTIAKHRNELKDKETFDIIYSMWQKYHLNGMHAGTPDQEKAVKEWVEQGNKFDYTAACNMLKELGIYEVNFTGATVGRYYDNETYKYGHGLVVQEIPGNDLLKIEHLLSV